MSHVRESVGTSKQGSTKALAGSGISSMSLSLMAWKPRIDEPSNPRPSVNVSSSSSFNGIEKCCQVPGRSVNRTSTICTPASLARRMTSAGDVPVDAFPPVAAVGSNVAVIEWAPSRVDERFRKRRAITEARGAARRCQEIPARTARKDGEVLLMVWKCANCCLKDAAFALQGLHEVQQLHRGKLPESVLHILLLPFEEDPPGHFVQLSSSADEVNAAAHGAE